jgi:hypothetical protein
MDTLACRALNRRKKLFGNPDWNGIDYLEVGADRMSLCVHFFGHVPEGVGLANIRIAGGARIRDVRAVSVGIDRARDAELDDCLDIKLDKAGDFSAYRLCLVEAAADDACAAEPVPLAGLDPRYACLDFSFKVDCPSDLDCQAQDACPPQTLPAPNIDYLAKDYASFRQLILDRLSLIMPDWQERHVPDLGIALVEVLAYAGDHLSYYQDAVATEAYLDTARRRISVRRHARLVGYRMHEGCNARAFVTVWTDADLPAFPARAFYFITGFAGIKAASGHVLNQTDLASVPPQSYEVYEPLAGPDAEFTFRAAHSEIAFYTWGDSECCLPRGATRATLLDSAAPADKDTKPQRALALQVGDILIFEEVSGPGTGDKADADPTHRQAVRLTKVTPGEDKLLGKLVLEIEWSAADALPFALCLSARLPSPDCRWIDGISMARGNVVLVDHGRSVSETLGPVETLEEFGDCACEGSIPERTLVPGKFYPALGQAPLTFGEPVSSDAPASRVLVQKPRAALPDLSLREVAGDAATGPTWSPRFDLIASGAGDRHVVAELDEDGVAHLRFGNGGHGRTPPPGARFAASYRVGSGAAGNAGAEAIAYLVLRNTTLSGVTVMPRNPLPAIGGSAPETTAAVKLLAPTAFRARRARAITADDYAELAGRHAGVQRAAAELRWMGSWYEAGVAIDPAGSETADAALFADIDRHLWRYRRMGQDVAVAQARYVPLDIGLDVSVLPHYTRGALKAALLTLFGSGRSGVFYPDNLTFGGGLYLSRLVALAKSVEGIETVTVTRLQRLGGGDSGALASGVLTLGAFEVARCDSDANFPENGRIDFVLRGGR